MKSREIIYFQPEGIKPKYCEAGVIMENDPDHIWFNEAECSWTGVVHINKSLEDIYDEIYGEF
jgi:hypothetical protein